MAITLNLDLEAFRTFANSGASADQAARVLRDGRVTNATVTSSALARLANRSSEAQAARDNNNQVRDALVTALKDQFGVTSFDALPASVKTALKGTHALSAAGDFKFVDGRSTSGRPLTQRRIATVLAAVDCEVAASVKTNAEKNPVSEAMVKERSNADHVKAFADVIINRLTIPGKNTPAVINSIFDFTAQDLISRFIVKNFCHLGDGKPEHSFQTLVHRFCKQDLQGCGVLSMCSSTPETVEAWRERESKEAFLEAIQQYNAAHPDSTYRV